MITFTNVLVEKRNRIILNIPSLHMEEKYNIGIFGSNGAGKTTLVKCLMGIEKYKGTISTSLNPTDIQVLMQKNPYPPYAKVKDILKLILDTNNLDSIMEIIKYFKFEDCVNKKIAVLSGGELQKLNLILVLSQEHKLLIVDEVTTGLDYDTRKKLIKYLLDHLENKQSNLLIISHYPEELAELTDIVIHIEEGEIKETLQTKDFISKYRNQSEEVA